jgi:hypothetical protein
MLSKQEEDRERRETLRNDKLVLGIVPRRELTDEQKAALERKIDEAVREEQGSTSDLSGRYSAVGGAQKVVGKAGDPWPKLPPSSPWSGAQPEPGAEPSFGMQLHSFDVPINSVQEKRR